MKHKLFSVFALFAISLLAEVSLLTEAGEFWLSTSKFVLKPGENLIVSFREGEDFLGASWEFTKQNISKLELHHKNTVKDVQQKIVAGKNSNLEVAVEPEGTHLLLLQTNAVFSETEADEFNAFLKAYELDEVISQRKKSNSADKNGRAFVSRYAKLIVQAGEKTDNTFRKEVSIPLDIIPVKNPYDLKIGDPVQFRIQHEGKALFGAKVRVWNFYNNRTTVQNIYSQQDGMISTHISNGGAWMVSVVKAVPSQNAEADWNTHWTSLVFGVK